MVKNFDDVKIIFESLESRDQLSAEVSLLKQVHGAQGLQISGQVVREAEGDFLYTFETNQKISVSVADCTAILLWGETRTDRFVAALHAGWRGTAAQIISKAIEQISPRKFSAWLSPSLCQNHFEVGAEVPEALGKDSLPFARTGKSGKFFLDLKAFQIFQLGNFKPINIHVDRRCTFCEAELISYRKSGGNLQGRRQVAVIERTAL